MALPLAAGRRTPDIAVLLLGAMLMAVPPAWAAPRSPCAAGRLMLWGDGRHDDTGALNAWFRGEPVVWAQTGRTVGPQIEGRTFRLSSTVYMPSGTGRTLDRFVLVWPGQGERVSGGTIETGDDPEKPALTNHIVKVGAAPGDGVPFAAPPPLRRIEEKPSNCLIS